MDTITMLMEEADILGNEMNRLDHAGKDDAASRYAIARAHILVELSRVATENAKMILTEGVGFIREDIDLSAE